LSQEAVRVACAAGWGADQANILHGLRSGSDRRTERVAERVGRTYWKNGKPEKNVIRHESHEAKGTRRRIGGMSRSSRLRCRLPACWLILWLAAVSVASFVSPAATKASGAALPAAAAGTGEGNDPELRGENPLLQTLRALEERIDGLNREQRRLLLQIDELRRKNREAARRLSPGMRRIVLAKARAALEEIQSARQAWENLHTEQKAAAGRFRRHCRKSDWDAALDDLSAIVRCGQRSLEQLKRELHGELKLMDLLRQAGSP